MRETDRYRRTQGDRQIQRMRETDGCIESEGDIHIQRIRERQTDV